MVEIFIKKGHAGSERIRYVHKIYVSEPHNKSYTASILLRDSLLSQDEEFIIDNWRERVRFSREYLTKRLKSEKHLTCAYCDKKGLIIEYENMRVPDKYKATIDHVIPISKGGPVYNEKNIVVACSKCNRKKGDMDLMDFIIKLKIVPEWVKLRLCI